VWAEGTGEEWMRSVPKNSGERPNMTQDELVAAIKEKLRPPTVHAAAYVKRPLITLVAPGRKRPFPAKGFPRAELLTVTEREDGIHSVWLYDAERLLTALNKHGIF
jgi:hypothetical protein